MRTLLSILLALIAIALRCEAQLASTLNEKSVTGTFYISVDDAATIYINGTKFYSARVGQSRSPETALKTGDRIVVHLHDHGGVRHFFMLFASSDGQSVVSFRNTDFKIVPDIDVTDFTSEEFKKWKKTPKQRKERKSPLPVKSYSEAFWGDLNRSIVACILTPKMFSQRPQ